jgi:hypothetical protein
MSRITQRGATGPLALVANGLFQTSTDAALATLVGTRWDLSDGREVTLVKNGAVALTPGVLVQDAAIVPNHQNIAVTAYQAYSANGNVPAKVTVTLGATAATANQYAGGFVVVNDANGEGQTLRIASHPAADASATLAITLEDGANTALTTSSEVCLLPAHGADVIIQPTTVTGAQVGVTLSPIAAAAYGFVVSRGIVSCLAQGAITVGLGISVGSVAGSVAVAAATTARLGFAAQAGVDTEYRAVYVNI